MLLEEESNEEGSSSTFYFILVAITLASIATFFSRVTNKPLGISSNNNGMIQNIVVSYTALDHPPD